MAGNVWEWVNEWYSDSYYQYCVDNSIVNDPPGPDTGSWRVLRGGSLGDDTDGLRAAFRYSVPGFGGYYFNGFRCARD